MSSLYEQWKPAIGDRVRIVHRDEMGAATQSGESGTVVALYPDEPEALCAVRYDADSGDEPVRHAAAELEPIGTKAGDVEAWEPTVGDRVEPMEQPENRTRRIGTEVRSGREDSEPRAGVFPLKRPLRPSVQTFHDSDLLTAACRDE